MKHYKNPENNQIYAYEEDGSQDAIIPAEFVLLSDAELAAIRAERQASATPPPTVDPIQKITQFLAANPDVAELLK